MSRTSFSPVPPRREARRGAKKAGDLRPHEQAYVLFLAACGRAPAEIRRAVEKAWGVKVSATMVSYQTGWHPERIQEYRDRIADEGELKVLAGIIEHDGRKATPIPDDAPVWVRYAEQLPPDYRPRPGEEPEPDDTPVPESEEEELDLVGL